MYAQVANGDYYIMNVGSGMYLNHGSSWGTHVTVDGAGCVITVAGNVGEQTLHHAGIASNKYQTEDGWSDNTNAGKFTFEDAGGGAYYIKGSNNKYYKWAGGEGQWGDEAVVADDKEETGAYKWIFVPKATREAFVAGNDVTYLIKNPDFTAYAIDWGKACTNQWTGDGVTNYANEEQVGNGYTGQFAEKWVAAPAGLADISHRQTISGLPAGKYSLSVTANAELQGTGAGTGAYVYAGTTAKTELGMWSTKSVEFKSTGADVEIGVKTVSTTANWLSFDKFRLTCVELAVSVIATASESPVTAEADKWYAVQIPASSTFIVTTTNGATINYTQDANAIGSEVSASAASGDEVELNNGTLYIKASAASEVTIAAKSYVYALGTATLTAADGKYVQNNTFSVTFPSEGSTDPEASAALVAGAKATVNGSEVALTATEHGFTFSLGELIASNAYSIAIPANVYGYAGHTMNENIALTVNTPAVFDGTYFVKTSDGRYLSRGDNYNTCAIVDNYGIAVNVATNESNITTFTFVDNNKKLFDADNGTVYTDNTTYPNWAVDKVDGGFNIINKNNRKTIDKPLAIEENTDANYKYDRLVTKNGMTAEVFTFEATTEHPAQMAAKKDAQAAAVAADAGISATTKAALDAVVNANYNLENVDFGAIAAGEIYQNQGDITKTITGLDDGLYKVSVNAIQRITFNSENYATEGKNNATTTLYANDQEVQIVTPYDQTNPSTTPWSSDSPADVKYGDYYYPNNIASAVAAFNAGNYLNEIYVNVTDGTLKFGIYKANKCGNGDWLYYANFKVEKLTQASATMAVNATAQYGTFCAPFDVTIPDGVTAYTVDGVEEGVLNMTDVETTIAANTPVVLYAASGFDAQTFYGKTVAGDPTSGLLTGVYKETIPTVGTYVLQNLNDNVAFYRVAEGKFPTIGANRCYLTVSSGSANVRAFRFDNNANAIEAISAIANNAIEAIYNANGVKVNALQKGINVVKVQNGKTQKVLVK